MLVHELTTPGHVVVDQNMLSRNRFRSWLDLIVDIDVAFDIAAPRSAFEGDDKSQGSMTVGRSRCATTWGLRMNLA